MVGAGNTRRENVLVHALHEKHPFYSFEGTRYKGDRDMYTYGAKKYLTNLKNHLTMDLERFMIRAVVALYPRISRNGKWTIINGIMKDRKREDEVEFVDKKASKVSTNEASAIRTVIQEHRAVLGLPNPTDKVSELSKDQERYDRLILCYFVFLDRELEGKAAVMLREETNEEWERRKDFLMGKRFNVVPLSNIKSHFGTIDSGILHGIMKEICSEFNVSREDFAGENRETYWKNIFNFKRLRVSKQNLFTLMIETDGVALCIHYRRLKRARPVPPSAAPVTKDEDKEKAGPATQEVEDNDLVVGAAKHEENKEEDPATQEVENNDFVVGADPGNTNIITIAVPQRAEYGTHSKLRQNDMRRLRFSRARYYRESGIMNARKKIEIENAGLKKHLEAMSKVTSRAADFEAFLKCMDVHVAPWEALWEEYTKPRWARLRMNPYCGKQRAFANFFNELSALKEHESQRLVVAYGAGRWKTHKGTPPAPTTRTYKENARRFVTIRIDEFRTSDTHHELECTLQRVEMEKRQGSPEDIAKYGPLPEVQMERRTKVRGLLAFVSTTNDGKKRMRFVNRDFNAAVNIRRCAAIEKRPPQQTRENFVGQPLKVQLYEKKLKPVVGGLPSKAGMRLPVSWRLLVRGAFAATTVHHWRQRFSFQRRLLLAVSMASALAAGVNPVDLARREMSFYADLFQKMTDSCFRKCVTRYHDGELQTGEGVCVDRCVFKYMGAVQRIGELLQEGQPMPAAGGAPSVQ